MTIHVILQIACILQVMNMVAQESPVLEAQPPVVKACSQNGIRSVRVRVMFAATNVHSAIAVIPRVVVPRQVWIKDVEDPHGSEHMIVVHHRPQLSIQSLEKLEMEGGRVATLEKGQEINIYGLYVPFLIDRREAIQIGAKPTLLLLNSGRTYEMRAVLDLWTDRQYQGWVRRGYLTRRDTSVRFTFDVPSDPNWDPCVDEPPFVNRGPAK